MSLTCTNADAEVAAGLDRLRDVTARLYQSQSDMRYIAYERRAIVADLRRRGMTCAAIADAIGTSAQAVWLMSRSHTPANTAEKGEAR